MCSKNTFFVEKLLNVSLPLTPPCHLTYLSVQGSKQFGTKQHCLPPNVPLVPPSIFADFTQGGGETEEL